MKIAGAAIDQNGEQRSLPDSGSQTWSTLRLTFSQRGEAMFPGIENNAVAATERA
jgi:hypothetical protein